MQLTKRQVPATPGIVLLLSLLLVVSQLYALESDRQATLRVNADRTDGPLGDGTTTLWGSVDILVNNAVRDYDAVSFSDIDWPDIQESMNVVVRGAFNCCKAAIPGMLDNGGGKIVNIGSLATEAPAPNQLKYVLSKSALVGLTRSIAVDYAAKNIQANLVCPSLIETELVAHIPKTFRDKVASDTPMQRNATTSDVAQAVVYLASSHSSFVTGQRIMVTGGLTPFL